MKKKFILTENQYNKLRTSLLEMRLRTYIFDWDDNILFMPTKIKMDKLVDGNWVPVDVSTEDFAKVRTDKNYRLRNNDPVIAFDNFRKTSSFIEDTKEAIQSGSFGPSLDKFKEALIYANPFAINTARGHKPEALKMGVKLFIDEVLTKDEKEKMLDNIKENLPLAKGLDRDEQLIDLYLDEMGEYYPVSSKEFEERFGLNQDGGGASNPEHSKQMAIEHFVKKVFRNVKKLIDSGKYTKLSVGFSDDDIKNVKAVEEFIESQLNLMYPELHFVVYDTSEKGKRKMVIKQDK